MIVSNAKMMKSLHGRGLSLVAFYSQYGAREFYQLVHVAPFFMGR